MGVLSVLAGWPAVYKGIQKQRVAALFLLIGFMASLLLLPAVAYAQGQGERYAPSLSETNPSPAPIAAGTQRAPNALAVILAEHAPAQDVKDHSKANNPLNRHTSMGEPVQPESKSTFKEEELADKRTATSSTRRNKDGTLTLRQYFDARYFKKQGVWTAIDSTLVEDKNAGDGGTIFGEAWGTARSAFTDETTFVVKDNEWQARFAPSNSDVAMMRVKMGDSQIGFRPVGAQTVNPAIVTKNGKQTVAYRELWKGVDVEYTVFGSSIKENIIIKNKSAVSSVSFAVDGAALKARKGGGYAVSGALNNEFSITPANLILNTFGFVSDASVYKQTYADGKITVSVDKAYVLSLPDRAFPAVIDPGIDRGLPGTNYMSFKTDGTTCGTVCGIYTGSLLDAGYNWQSWRGALKVPYARFTNPGYVLTHANLHITQRTNTGYWTGTYDGRWIDAWHASCLSYGCLGEWGGEAYMGTSGDINVTNLYRNRIAQDDFGAFLMLTGEEGPTDSFKEMDPAQTYVDFTYRDVPPVPTIAAPMQGQTVTDPQVSFRANPVVNPNGGTVQYGFCVSTGAGCAGAVMLSGFSESTQWTIPDGVLQDGTSYYVQARAYDPGGAGYSVYGGGISFKVDMRTGKQKTQTYDTLGPVDVDLATGTVTTSQSSHTSAALGGSLGVSLDYNSPLRSRQGLVGQYWNNQTMSGDPTLTRIDQTVDFAWSGGSPLSGTITTDGFSVRWSGWFVAPKTGSYQFGAKGDDGTKITVGGTVVMQNWNVGAYGLIYGSAVSLQEGQVVPLTVEYFENNASAYMQLYVKGAVNEQIVPDAWLQTGPRSVAQPKGLIGRYFFDDGSHSFTSANNTLFMQRTDPLLNFSWGDGAPVANGTIDNFLVRWTGYFTAPVGGSYQFGTEADDGTRITVDGNQVLQNWNAGAYGRLYGGAITLTAGQTVPITVDYFEHTAGAYMRLFVKGAVTEQIVPSAWLSTKSQVLPDGWNLGVDADGDVSYDQIKINQNSAVLTDSTGSTHEYTWTGSGYKPPVNEDGQLVRNADGTFTLQDVDGRTYVFNADGTLKSVTSPIDDRKPAALKYEYEGTPARLKQIADGVTANRWANVFYSGSAECGTAPATFDASAPANMLCAVKTNDGRATYFYYKEARLARIAEPGGEATDYQYDTLGRIVGVRDAQANDAIAAGVRADDATAVTQIAYDELGRAQSITQPAATPGATRIQHTVEYGKGGTASWQTDRLVGDSVMLSTPIAVSWGQGRIDVFARGAANDLVHRWYIDGNWSNWESLGGCLVGDPAAASWAPHRLDVFIQGCDASGPNFWHIWWDGFSWSPFQKLGSQRITSSPSAAAWEPGRLDVVAKGQANEVLQTWYDGTWHDWQSLGGCIADAPAAVSWGANRLDVLAKDCTNGTNNLMHRAWSGASWSGWTALNGHITSAPSAASFENGRIDVIATEADNSLKQLTYQSGSWGSWQNLGGCANGTPSLSVRWFNNLDLFTKGCDTGPNLHMRTFGRAHGVSRQHITGMAEPHGFARQVEYDSIFRTTKDTDIANLSTITLWDPAKDLVLSTTDPTGNTSTTLYDDDDRPIHAYGPAPAAWFAANRTPLAAHAAQVPHTQTAYDEGIIGPGVAWHNFKGGSLFGAPKLHTTGFNDPNNHFYANMATAPITPDSGMDGIGFSATGKLRVTQTATYNFTAYHDDAARLWINDTLLFDRWSRRTDTVDGVGASMLLEAGKVYRFRFDHATINTHNPMSLHMTGGNKTTPSQDWTGYVSSGYNLVTSTKTYDSTIGDSTATTHYGPNPELGLAHSTTVDAGGLNLATTHTYETQGAAGSFLRQTSKTLPGGGTTTYTHYTATDTADNPCTVGVTEAHLQAGLAKGKIEADPDGAGPQASRTSETIYDDAGRAVASRLNNDPWTCTTYDARSRVAQTVAPTIGTMAGRTTTHNYAVSGNPLVTNVADPEGIITTTVDLLGRTTAYTSAVGGTTTYTYDNVGRLTSHTGPAATQEFAYDTLGRLAEQKYSGTVVAVPHYDIYGRLSSVDYPVAGQQKLSSITRDDLGRTTARTYTLGDGTTTISDAVTYSQSGQVISGTENGQAKSYGYDKAGRLTSATIAGHTYAYNFGTASSCANQNTGKNSNRTSMTVDSAPTTYCYDQADRLISSTDATVDSPVYDAHGNTTQLGTGAAATVFTYDATDRLTKADQTTPAQATTFYRDPKDRLTRRIISQNGTTTNSTFYGYTGSGDSPDFIRDGSWNVVERYVRLAGGVLMTIRPGSSGNTNKVFSLGNVHGDVMATTNSSGGGLATFQYDPFGTVISTAKPGNMFVAGSMGWVGSHQKITEKEIALQPINMGARGYIPKLGRFLQVDPVEGGVQNNYVYPVDAVNTYDLNGMFISLLVKLLAPVIGKQAVKQAVKQAPTTSSRVAPAVTSSRSSARVVGSRSAPLMPRTAVVALGNKAAVINDRLYRGHALNQMQNGGIYPSVVENTIKWGNRLQSTRPDTIKFYEPANDITVILNQGGNVVTTWYGR